MPDETIQGPPEVAPEPATTDWADLRAQAAKLGISLSQLQQLQLEKKMRLAKKNRPIAPQPKPEPPEDAGS